MLGAGGLADDMRDAKGDEPVVAVVPFSDVEALEALRYPATRFPKSAEVDAEGTAPGWCLTAAPP